MVLAGEIADTFSVAGKLIPFDSLRKDCMAKIGETFLGGRYEIQSKSLLVGGLRPRLGL